MIIQKLFRRETKEPPPLNTRFYTFHCDAFYSFSIIEKKKLLRKRENSVCLCVCEREKDKARERKIKRERKRENK